MKETFVLSIFLFSQLFISGKAYAQEEPSILVGVEYFSGWWKPSPNKWERQGKDWRTQYPERIPLLGEYNSQETMDKEIDAAATYGIDFFSILWYYPGQVKSHSRTDRCEFLNAGLKHFMNSPNCGRMKFMVELCNHAPFSVITDNDWDECMEVRVEAMKHPSYLRIDGKAVLKIHGAHQFYLDNGSSIDRSRQVLKRLRQKGLHSGVGELLIMVGAYGVNPITDEDVFVRIGEVDGTMQYMDATNLPQKETDYSYDELAARAEQVRHIRKNDAIPYVPYFPAGWNPKPWSDPRASFRFPSRRQFKTSLLKVKSDLLNSSNFGFPRKDKSPQKAFTIYAWNEYGEGGFIAPTRGDRYMKLEVISEVFGK